MIIYIIILYCKLLYQRRKLNMCRLRTHTYYIIYIYIHVHDGITHSVFRFVCQWVPFPTLNQNSLCLSSRHCSSPVIRGSHTKLLLFHPVCGRSRLRLWQLIYRIYYIIYNLVGLFFSSPVLGIYALITSTRAWCVCECVWSVVCVQCGRYSIIYIYTRV